MLCTGPATCGQLAGLCVSCPCTAAAAAAAEARVEERGAPSQRLFSKATQMMSHLNMNAPR